MVKTLKDRIIETVIKTQNVSQKQIDDVLALQNKQKIGLDAALIEKGIIKEKDLLVLLVRELNIPFINLSKFKIDPALKEVIPERVARQYQVIPLSLLEDTLTVALSDPLNVFLVDDLKNITGKEVDIVMSTNTDILKALDNFYGVESAGSVAEITKDIEVEDFELISGEVDEGDADEAVDESKKAPIIRMVNLIVRDALRQRASDIHIEPMREGMRVRYRIDGILKDVFDIPKENQNAVIVRIKIMSRLDITSNHIPQDGRFKLKITGKEVDFRVSILPTTFGQKVVMRVLDKGNLSIGLDGLGFSEKSLKIMKAAIKKPFGMVLVTGPTGSGKSTTLYSVMSELNTVERNIITVEDPVEYLLEGLTQIQARPEIGLTFAEGLRAILRQSPDVVMVGEIRDNETADIAVKASLTGQLVFSTLHTNDAAGALTRLVDMGVEPFLVASSLVLVTAQRLCRKICPECKEPEKVSSELIAKFGIKVPGGRIFSKGKGCEKCRQTGYHGRTCITEVLDVDDDIRRLLLSGKTSDEIKLYAREKKGMATLWDDAVSKSLEGITTLEEVLRTTSTE